MREDLQKISDYLATRGLICHSWESKGLSGVKEKLECYATGDLKTKTKIDYIEITPSKYYPTSTGYNLHIVGDISNWHKKSEITDYLKTEFWDKEKDVRVDFVDEAQIYVESDDKTLLVAIDDIMRIMEGKI